MNDSSAFTGDRGVLIFIALESTDSFTMTASKKCDSLARAQRPARSRSPGIAMRPSTELLAKPAPACIPPIAESRPAGEGPGPHDRQISLHEPHCDSHGGSRLSTSWLQHMAMYAMPPSSMGAARRECHTMRAMADASNSRANKSTWSPSGSGCDLLFPPKLTISLTVVN